MLSLFKATCPRKHRDQILLHRLLLGVRGCFPLLVSACPTHNTPPGGACPSAPHTHPTPASYTASRERKALRENAFLAEAVNPGQAGRDLPRTPPHPWTDIGGVQVRYAVIGRQPELTGSQARCLEHALQPSLPRAFSQEAFYLGGWGQGGGDGRRAADLLTLGRQEAHLGIAWDSDVFRKRPGGWEGQGIPGEPRDLLSLEEQGHGYGSAAQCA